MEPRANRRSRITFLFSTQDTVLSKHFPSSHVKHLRPTPWSHHTALRVVGTPGLHAADNAGSRIRTKKRRIRYTVGWLDRAATTHVAIRTESEPCNPDGVAR
jgi:hypothetical protein